MIAACRRRFSDTGRLLAAPLLLVLILAMVIACSRDGTADVADVAPVASQTVTPTDELAPARNPCGTTLQAVIDAATPGAVIDLAGCSYDQAAIVTKPLTLIGGTLTTQTSNPWEVSLLIDSDGVTVEGWAFIGGGVSLSIIDRSDIQVRGNTFRDHIGTPIAIFGPVSNVLFEGNDIVNTRTRKSSALIGRGAEEANPCSRVGRNVTIRDNFVDQGPGSYDESVTVGWFGIELKCFEDVLIEGNHLKGGHTLISLPDSNRVQVRNNVLDLRGFAYWGVEIPQAHDIVIEANTVAGDGPQGNDAAFSANSGSQRMTIRFNTVSSVRALVDSPVNSIVTDNCLVDVLLVWEYADPGSGRVERNGPC